jgi:putative SOS response-associated peptidase YedK
MCGSYSFFIPIDEAEQQLQKRAIPNVDWFPHYNAAPTQAMPVITNEFPNVIQFLRWGLVPKWSNDISIGSKMINTRSESIVEKPAFKNIFKYKRCLVLADGYYEWQEPKLKETSRQKKSKQVKQPYRFHLPGNDLLLLAGLWDSWGLDGLQTFSIITCPSNNDISLFHHRMPVILSHEEARLWLDNSQEQETWLQLLKPAPDGLLEIYPVSTYLNKAGNEGEEVIKKMETQPTLFDL